MLALLFTTYTLQWLAVMGFLPTLLLEKFGISRGTASLLTGLVVFMNVPGNLFGGWLLNKEVPRWRLLALACMGMGGAPLYAPNTGLIATTTGVMVQGGQTGQVLGPPALAWLISLTGSWQVGAWFLGAVAGLGLGLSFLFSKMSKD